MPWHTRFSSWISRRLSHRQGPARISEALWQEAVQGYPFLVQLGSTEREHLQRLVELFLHTKEFTGAHGLQVTDAMAVAIAAQACVLLLYWGEPEHSLRWYNDFVGIVVHPDDVLAQREVVDEAGVVHHYEEVLMGETMEGGPIMLSWAAVQSDHPDMPAHSNVVIHEFAHKLDLRDGTANGCPPLPAGFLGAESTAEARKLWSATWSSAFAQFQDEVALHERFSQPAPYLDAYGAEDPAEFFAVACEAWVVDRSGLQQAMPGVVRMLDAFFQRPEQAQQASPK